MKVLTLGDTRIERKENAGNHDLSLLKDIYVEHGTKEDWLPFAALHYKGQNLAAGPRFMRCVHIEGDRRTVIGVMVFANPMPLNRGRGDVFPHLRQNQGGSKDTTLINKRRMQWINANMTWCNRIVLDTMYRSAGIAYRFNNIGYRMYCTKHNLRFVELISSMGRFNPFNMKSGMRFIKPRPNAALEAGIKLFKTYFRSHPCDHVELMKEINTMSTEQAAVIEKVLRQFYFAHSAVEKSGSKMHNGMTRINRIPLDKIVKEIIQLVFGSTIYCIYKNPDYGRVLPERIPITAFDNQGTNEPLDLERAFN